MEANRKKVQIVFVPSETGVILKPHNPRRMFYRVTTLTTPYIKSSRHTRGHLHFTSDAKFKVFTWVIHQDLGQSPKLRYITISGDIDFRMQRKIIVSTDPKLTGKIPNKTYSVADRFLAQPSQAFLEAYCTQEGIDEVEVEMEIDMDNSQIEVINNNGKLSYVDQDRYQLKVNSHNEVTCHRIIEKTYTEKEVVELCRSAYSEGEDYGYESSPIEPHALDREHMQFVEWAEQNF